MEKTEEEAGPSAITNTGVHAKIVKGGPPRPKPHEYGRPDPRSSPFPFASSAQGSLAREVKERVLNGTAEARALIQTCTRRAVPHLRRSPDCGPLRAAGPIPRASQKLVKDFRRR
jgi:hypothetical protein